MNSIGNFFVKIGLAIKKGFLGLINWVKNTAWVQPLLIVGIIFGAILAIKPVTEWIGGLLNPDEVSYAFYNENNARNLFTEKQIDDFIAQNKGDTVIVYYDDTNSTCGEIEKDLRTIATQYTNYSWKCVNTNITDEESQEYEDKENFYIETYQYKYEELLNSNKYKDLFKESDLTKFDLSNGNINTPMFIRLKDSNIVGVKVSLEDDKKLDIERFLTNNIDKDWTMSWSDYKTSRNNA